jgi:hypothetical protein
MGGEEEENENGMKENINYRIQDLRRQEEKNNKNRRKQEEK